MDHRPLLPYQESLQIRSRDIQPPRSKLTRYPRHPTHTEYYLPTSQPSHRPFEGISGQLSVSITDVDTTTVPPTLTSLSNRLCDMPSLYGVGISFRLAAQPLTASLTEKVELKRGYQTAANSKHAEKALMDSLGTPLPENRVPFPGEKNNFAVNWLGEVQFLQAVVQTSYEERDLDPTNEAASATTTRRVPKAMSTSGTRALLSHHVQQARTSSGDAYPMFPLPIRAGPQFPSESSRPESKALILHVKLSDKTFLFDPFDRTPQQLKIEIFFNGQLANCMLLHARDFPAGATSFNLLFAGTRVDYHAERPWVMHTPDLSVTAETCLQKSTATELQNRWAELCNALMKEADTRGIDVNGKRPPTGRYLRDLVTMQMPESVKNMQKDGSDRFGVIDVAVTVGSGRKMNVGVECLRTPTRLHDERYKYEVTEMSDCESVRSDGSTVTLTNTKTNDQEAEGGSHLHDSKLPQATVQEESVILPAEACPHGSMHAMVGRHIIGSDASTSSLPMSKMSDSYMLPGFSEQAGAGEPSRKRSRSEAAKVIHRNPGPRATRALHSTTSIHTSLSQQSGPSHSGHSTYTAPSLTSRKPQTQSNVNQYDSFEHADSYQPPYLAMIADLSSRFLTDSKPSPLRYSSSAYTTSPPPVPNSGEVISKTETSVLTSPNSRHTTSHSESDPLKPGVRQTGRTLLDSSIPLESDSSRKLPLRWSVESNHSLGNSPCLQPGPRTSTAYVPAHLVPSKDPSLPTELFMITENGHANLPYSSRPLFLQVVRSRTDLKRVVIRLRGRVVRSHYFTKPQTLILKTRAVLATTVNLQSSIHDYRGNMIPADMLRGSSALLRADRAPAAPTMTSSPSTRASPRPEMHGALHDGSGYPSCGGCNISNTNPNAIVTRAPPKALATPQTYGFISENPDATILGEQGPGENHLPSDLFRKPSMNENSREMARHRSTPSTQTNMTPTPFVDGPSELENDCEMNWSISFEDVDTVSVSGAFLSAITEATGSSFPSSTIDSLSDLLSEVSTPNFTANETRSDACFFTRPNIEGEGTVPSNLSMTSQNFQNDGLGSTSSKRRRTLPSNFALDGSSDSSSKSLRGNVDRSDITINLPLDKNCVIQHAVASRDGSALRQIKSERMGVFQEETVIVGCRYFVSGC